MRQSRCVRLAGAKVEREQQQQDVHYESIDGVGISASSMDGRLEGDAELGLGHGFCTLRPCKKILRVSDLAVTLPALIGASHDRGNLPDFSPVLPSTRHESKQPWPPLPFLSHIRRRSLPLVLVPPHRLSYSAFRIIGESSEKRITSSADRSDSLSAACSIFARTKPAHNRPTRPTARPFSNCSEIDT